MSDADMFQRSRTKRQHFIDNKAAFVAFDADFDDPYDADWLASIEASEAFESADTRDAGGRLETEDVNEVMTLAHKKHIEIKYFAEKAYGQQPTVLAKMGITNYTEARASQSRMAKYLQNLYEVSNSAEFKPALLAVNCSQAKIDSILTVKNSLSTEDTEQNVYLENEAQATKARITQYNETADFWHKVNRASKSIFYDQPELLNLFLFPRSSEPAESFNVLGSVVTGPASMALVGVTVQIESLGLSTTTDSNGEYGFAAVPAGSYTIKFTKGGFADLTLPITVPASGQFTLNAVMSV
jgi:hypothetical protein